MTVTWRNRVVGLALACLSILIVSLLLDRILGLFGFPSEYVQITHPASYVAQRNNPEFTFEFSTNSMGIPYREVPLTKPDSTLRFIVLGDSFTEGWGVEQAQRYTERMEAAFSTDSRAVEFVNCGLSGTAPMEYARVLSRVSFQYQPDGVLIALYPNDISETDAEATVDEIDNFSARGRSGLKRLIHALWPRLYTMAKQMSPTDLFYEEGAGDLVADVVTEAHSRGIAEAEIEAWQQRINPVWVEAANAGDFNGAILSFGLLRTDHWTSSLDISTPQAERKYQVMMSLMEEIVRRCRDRELWVGVVLLPAPVQVSSEFGVGWEQSGVQVRSEWLTAPTELENRLSAWSAEEAVPFVNLAPYYRQAAQASPDFTSHYHVDGHFTAQGHQLAADTIADWLLTQPDLPLSTTQ